MMDVVPLSMIVRYRGSAVRLTRGFRRQEKDSPSRAGPVEVMWTERRGIGPSLARSHPASARTALGSNSPDRLEANILPRREV